MDDDLRQETRKVDVRSRAIVKDVNLSPDIPEHLPYMIDDTSICNRLGIERKTIWWLVTQNRWLTEDEKEREDSGTFGDGPQKMWDKKLFSKRSGGTRVIHEPLSPMKGIHRILLPAFLYKFKHPEHYGAYVPGRSVVDMAERHVGYDYKLSLDVKDFFHWCHRSDIQRWLRDKGYPEGVVEIFSTLFTVPLDKKGHKDPVYVLSQGSPLSGAVSNHIAHRQIDRPIKKTLDKHIDAEWVYSRYSDNIEISVDAEYVDVGPILEDVKTELAKNHFWLNDDKTHIQKKKDPRKAMRVLGINVGEKLNIPGPKYKKLRAEAHNALTGGFDDKENGYIDSLESRLAYWAQVRPDRIEPLQNKVARAKKTHLTDCSA